MAASIKASSQGLIAADTARRHRGWSKTAPALADVAHVSVSTVKRFWMGKAIAKDAFVAICEALGVDWQEITELSSGHLHKLLDEGVEVWNEWKRFNPPLGYNFDNADLSNADLRGIDFSHTSVVKANLNGANLENADLSRADLTNANFSEANLKGANLTATQALSTIFTGANLTGACLQDWNINRSTRLENTICDYIYLEYLPSSSSQKFRGRRPQSGNFASGEFAALLQKAVETFDLILSDRIDWTAFLQSFQELRTQYGDNNLSIQGIEKKSGDVPVIRLGVSSEVDKADVESFAKVLHQEHIQSLEIEYKAKLAARELELETYKRQIETYRQENANLLNIVKQLAERPMNLIVEGSAINFGGDIYGSVNVQSVSHNLHDGVIEFTGNIQIYKLREQHRNLITEDLKLSFEPEQTNWFETPKLQEQLQNLIAGFEDLSKNSPQLLTAEDYIKEGDALYFTKNYHDAIASYDKAIDEYDKVMEKNQNASKAWFGKGNALRKLKRYEEAITSYKKAIEIDPSFYLAWTNLGKATRRGGTNYEEAIVWVDKAIEIRPDYFRAWYNKACYLARLNKKEEAIEALKKAISLEEESCRVIAKTDKDFDSIREDERFKQLVYG